MLLVNSKDCAFFQKDIAFLGHVIHKGELSSDGQKTIAILNWQKPTSIRELQKFLGFSNYYRQFMSNFSNLVSPMYSVIK
jgi:hypothetical protein